MDIQADLAKVVHTLESIPNRLNIMDNNSSLLSRTQFDAYKQMVRGNQRVQSQSFNEFGDYSKDLTVESFHKMEPETIQNVIRSTYESIKKQQEIQRHMASNTSSGCFISNV